MTASSKSFGPGRRGAVSALTFNVRWHGERVAWPAEERIVDGFDRHGLDLWMTEPAARPTLYFHVMRNRMLCKVALEQVWAAHENGLGDTFIFLARVTNLAPQAGDTTIYAHVYYDVRTGSSRGSILYSTSPYMTVRAVDAAAGPLRVTRRGEPMEWPVSEPVTAGPDSHGVGRWFTDRSHHPMLHFQCKRGVITRRLELTGVWVRHSTTDPNKLVFMGEVVRPSGHAGDTALYASLRFDPRTGRRKGAVKYSTRPLAIVRELE